MIGNFSRYSVGVCTFCSATLSVRTFSAMSIIVVRRAHSECIPRSPTDWHIGLTHWIDYTNTTHTQHTEWKTTHRMEDRSILGLVCIAYKRNGVCRCGRNSANRKTKTTTKTPLSMLSRSCSCRVCVDCTTCTCGMRDNAHTIFIYILLRLLIMQFFMCMLVWYVWTGRSDTICVGISIWLCILVHCLLYRQSEYIFQHRHKIAYSKILSMWQIKWNDTIDNTIEMVTNNSINKIWTNHIKQTQNRSYISNALFSNELWSIKWFYLMWYTSNN